MVSDRHRIDRRHFLSGRVLPDIEPRTAAPPRYFHVSSAVVTARPERCRDVAREIAALPQTEVHGIEGSKIVVVMEGETSGEIGSRLTRIALMDDVFSANLVFEQIGLLDDHGEKA